MTKNLKPTLSVRAMIKIWALLAILFLPLLTACSTAIERYQGSTPALKLETFFNGPLTAHAIIQDRNGRVIRRFKATMVGSWQGDKGILNEEFIYDDGEIQHRVWHLEKLPNGEYRGRADDVLGDATGTVSGFAFNWQYTLNVPVDGKVWAFQLDDWMYLIDQDRLINRATMRKFGITVAELTLWIERG